MHRSKHFTVLHLLSFGLVFPLAACGGADPAESSGGAAATTQSTTNATGAGGNAAGVGGSGNASTTTGGTGGAGSDLVPQDCAAASAKVKGLDGTAIANVLACTDVVYDPVVNLSDVQLDMYVPPGYVPGAHAPAIIFLHGGGWRAGSKGDVNAHQLDYLKRGYFVFSLNYRLSDFGSTKNPVSMTTGAPPVNATAIQDVKTAIQFIRARCGGFIDADNMVLWGFSAGAHLAVLAGVSSNDEDLHPELAGRSPTHESTAVKAVVAQSPPLDFSVFLDPTPSCGSLAVADPSVCGTEAMPIGGKCVTIPTCTPGTCAFGDEYATVGRPAVEHMLGASITNPPTGVTASASPLGFVDSGDAALYVLAGKCDGTVPPIGAKNFGPAANAKGGHVTIKLVESAGHMETLDVGTNPTGDADVRSWLESQGLPTSTP